MVNLMLLDALGKPFSRRVTGRRVLSARQPVETPLSDVLRPTGLFSLLVREVSIQGVDGDFNGGNFASRGSASLFACWLC
jgi:hypothetical protein